MADEVFRKRGVSLEVAEGAFFRYGDDGGPVRSEHVFVGDPYRAYGDERSALEPKEVAAAIRRVHERQARAPGMMMRRFPVPEADPFLFAEQRPDRPVWSGEWPKVKTHRSMSRGSRRKHEGRDKATREDVRRGLKDDELRRLSSLPGWAVTEGADHRGMQTDARHPHVHVAKYLFPANRRTTEPYEHDHRGVRWLSDHLYQEHDWPRYWWEPHAPDVDPRELLGADGQKLARFMRQTRTGEVASFLGGQRVRTVAYGDLPDPDEAHPHARTVDEHFYAKRLSSHPMGFARIAGADRVCFAIEGCLKEAALVTAGEATFSCPSVGQWDAPELRRFVEARLLGRLVLVIPDSDAWANDQVVMQALLCRERLRELGARAEVAVPTPEPSDCELHGEPAGAKRGVDDMLADGGRVDDMVWMWRELPARPFPDWLDEHPPVGRRAVRSDRVPVLAAVLRWVALHADEGGRSTAALQTVAKHVRPELELLRGRPLDHRSVVVDVSRAVQELDRYGALSGAESLKDRQMWREGDEWPGELVVHEDVRARTVRRTVPELEREVKA